MRRPEDVRAGTVKLSILAVLALFSVIPGAVLSNLKASEGPHGQTSAPGHSHPHRRLKRGWIWKQLFVPEEDPTPQVIGQVPPQAGRHPSPSFFFPVCCFFLIISIFCSSSRTPIEANPPSDTSYQEKELATCSR